MSAPLDDDRRPIGIPLPAPLSLSLSLLLLVLPSLLLRRPFPAPPLVECSSSEDVDMNSRSAFATASAPSGSPAGLAALLAVTTSRPPAIALATKSMKHLECGSGGPKARSALALPSAPALSPTDTDTHGCCKPWLRRDTSSQHAMSAATSGVRCPSWCRRASVKGAVSKAATESARARAASSLAACALTCSGFAAARSNAVASCAPATARRIWADTVGAVAEASCGPSS